jgi:metallophosphoesterase superfamily enzyme
VTKTTEWGVMELAPRTPHGNTRPENRVTRGHVHPCTSRVDAERRVSERAKASPHNPLAIVTRTVTVIVTAWETP